MEGRAGAMDAFYDRNDVEKRRSLVCLFAGLAVVLVVHAFYVAAGDSIVVRPFDELDGSIESLQLANEHAGEDVIPELMNGLPASCISGSGYLSVLFGLLPDFLGYSALAAFVALVGYIGLFALLRELGVRPSFALLCALAYALLPFFPLYGLSSMGVPLFSFGAVRMWKDPNPKNLVLAMLLTLFFTVFSSLIFIGYALIALTALAALVGVIRGGERRRSGWCMLVIATTLVAGYVALNPEILSLAATSIGEESSRAEMVLVASPVTIGAFWDVFANGHYHVPSSHAPIIVACLIAMAAYAGACVARRRRVLENDGREADDEAQRTSASSGNGDEARRTSASSKDGDEARRAIASSEAEDGDEARRTSASSEAEEEAWSASTSLFKVMMALFAFAVFIALFYVAFHSHMVTTFREMLPGGLTSFQFDRIYWMYPAIWYCLLGVAGELVARLAEFGKKVRPFYNIGHRSVGLAARALPVAFVACCAFACVGMSAQTSAVLETLRANYLTDAAKTDHNVLTWKRYYADDLFQQIADDIGRDQADYRVVSVGLYPNLALHSGFYVLDGYFTVYPLEYKHQFRNIIAGELERDEMLRTYFDDWGSRCYVFAHETGKRYLYPKDEGFEIKDLRIDAHALKDMGGEYVISGVPILNADECGLKLVNAYENDQSYYRLHLYQVV